MMNVKFASKKVEMFVNLEFGVHNCQIWLLDEVYSYLKMLVKDRR